MKTPHTDREITNRDENPLLHDTWKLLSKYRDVTWSLELSVQQVKKSFEIEYGTSIDEFLDSIYLAGVELSGTDMEYQAKCIERSNKMLKLVDKLDEIGGRTMYIKRHAEKTVRELSKMFGAVLVAGPRQVGKTTMLAKVTDGMNYATLDDPILRASAEEQSGTFFKDTRSPRSHRQFWRRRNCRSQDGLPVCRNPYPYPYQDQGSGPHR